MSPGVSVIDTKSLPQLDGKQQWIDKRTFSIPVKLYPNKIYWLAFNNARFQNFKNLDGVPLNPDDLLFITKVSSSSSLNKKSFNEFLEIFPKQYSYASLKGVNWKSLLEQNRAEFENSGTPTEFALKLIRMLRIAEDPHMWVEVEGQRYETGKLKIVENNYSAGILLSLLKQQTTSKNFGTMTGVF
jgi:hypothetical protein